MQRNREVKNDEIEIRERNREMREIEKEIKREVPGKKKKRDRRERDRNKERASDWSRRAQEKSLREERCRERER